MHPLPVFATAGAVYSFLLREAGPILRLSWFPTLIVTIVGYLAVRAGLDVVRDMLASGKIPAQEDMNAPGWDIASNLVAVIGTSVVAVALHRVILFGDRHPGSYVYLRFGKVEWLFILLSVLFFFAIMIVVLIGTVLAALSEGLAALYSVVAALAIIFLVVRYSPVLPNTVVEGRYNFAKAWSLTRGHFWRLVGLWIVVTLPAAIVFFLVSAALLKGLVTTSSTTDTAALMDVFETFALRTLLLSFPASIIFGALGVGVLSYTYKALNGIEPDQVITPQ